MLKNIKKSANLKVIHQSVWIAPNFESISRYKVSFFNDKLELKIIKIMAFFRVGQEFKSPFGDIEESIIHLWKTQGAWDA